MTSFVPVGWRKTPKRSRGAFASGKHAIAICDRTGKKHPWKEMVVEPGTGWIVHKSESDGMWSKVAHPQNFTPAPSDAQALPWARPETDPNYESSPPFVLADADGSTLISTSASYEGIEVAVSGGVWHYGDKSYV